MAIDIRQFHQTFLEESLDGLARMEALLLRLEQDLAHAPAGAVQDADPETLNTIFRVVHSIKGSSGTFGFRDITDFAHVLESLLDIMREGRVGVTRELINLLLKAGDGLRHLLTAAQTHAPVEEPMIQALRGELEALLSGGVRDRRPARTNDPAATGAGNSAGPWHIAFRPKPHLFKTGNDPLRILRELEGLGKLRVQAETDGLPAWGQFDPETCYLAWRIDLAGDAPRAAVAEAFAWVSDDCQLEIVPAPARRPKAPDPKPHAPEADHPHDAAEGRVNSIRVNIPKVDALVNTVGELVITQAMLGQIANNFTPDKLPILLTGLAQLERNLRELQDSVMSIRMVPLGFIFGRLPRLVRDMCQRLGKNVEIRIGGERTELDKTVIERISDPILHIIRNCMDHGIEAPAARRAAGKPEIAHIRLDAYQKGGNVMIEIEDDGRGLQREKIHAEAVKRGLIHADTPMDAEHMDHMIFVPGFSTAEVINDISGRGVGMDVVHNNITDLGGNVEVASEPGKGTRFAIRLPLTLAILEGLSVVVGTQTYILPLVSITESIRVGQGGLSRLPGGGEVFMLREEYLPLIRLYERFDIAPRSTNVADGIIVVVEAEGRRVGLFVDDLLGQQQVVIKSLETNYRKIDGIAAATIMSDGTVALILDVGSLTRAARAGTGRRFRGTDAAAPVLEERGAGGAMH
ncbi:MAG: hypothetical protein A2637_00355 [Candidatus Muproteobacteria bacterium RIFCSPHIGHO2_01_FULL_65_16]|uniref:Chemotaxis protein CheA n=1 Tax=Candidatus Muproteobacteria bacterium RIFCSPHIGHO2_01_FULL_65_16 TaxID=1817764 RepID=A0A1F6TI04_9PROT|nr:MAG: hypothetical protein A2637_00355 [Candidatus Muproteobacteria bacterium RIFCSPHIGHO2_01_FULL_65_16]